MNILKIDYRRYHNVPHTPYESKIKVEDVSKTHEAVLQDLKATIEDDLDGIIKENDWKKAEMELLSFWRKEKDRVNIKIHYHDEEEDVIFIETGEGYNILTIFAERDDDKERMLYCPNAEIQKDENRWFSFGYVPIKKIQNKLKQWENKSKEELMEELILLTI